MVRVADDICYKLSSVIISVRVLESGVCVYMSHAVIVSFMVHKSCVGFGLLFGITLEPER